MKRLLLAAITASLMVSPTVQVHAQELKVGVVDLTRVITEYYKFKEARNTLQDEASKAQKEINEALAYGQKLRESFNKIQQEAQDPILNEQLKQKKLTELREKQQEALQWDRDFQDLRQKRQKALADRQGRMFTGIREEILVLVKAKAERDGYSFVLEKSVMGASPKIPGLGIPLMLHAEGGIDFSDELIVDLNKNAPAEDASGGEAAE